ncbi:MAG TPA: hypothetical protein VJ302_12660 [Blastocatellia bacterium]|nr:hypothetical protein [Blastocatellia bacterium]
MHTDRFVKVMLVLVASLLLLNAVINFSPSSAAAPPPFLQKGSLYKLDRTTPVRVLEVDESGWVKVQEINAAGQPVDNQFANSSYWINTNILRTVEGYATLK